MTRQETFKRRIRARMAKTGERYGAARRILIQQAAAAGEPRRWASDPEMSDEAVREATGRGWNEWCDVIDAWPGHEQGHTAVAAHLQEQHGVPGWWAQTVTVGWERITGRRLKHQRPDGTFEVNKSRTIEIDAEALRALLIDDDDRTDLFPGLETELRSRPSSKNVRIAIGGGTAEFSIEPRGEGRATITVQHAKLGSPDEVEQWKAYWAEWLDAADGS